MVDGYSAPVTGGNFVRNVVEGVYCDSRLRVDQGAVLAGAGAIPGAPPQPPPTTSFPTPPVSFLPLQTLLAIPAGVFYP